MISSKAAIGDTQVDATNRDLAELLPALQRLDHLLEQAIVAADIAFGPEAATDHYRGLYINANEVERLLQRPPGAPLFFTENTEAALPNANREGARFQWLKEAFDLTTFEMDLMLIALAPDLDRRYERLYAYLQDHVSLRRPSVDLALHLLCPTAANKIERRRHFDPDAPLIRHGLLHLITEPNQSEPSLLAHTLRVDEQILRFLLHQDSLDSRLASCCRLLASYEYWADLPLERETQQVLPTLVRMAWAERRPLRLYFCGLPGAGKEHAAAALAGELGRSLLAIDMVKALDARIEFKQLVRLALRYGWFYGVIPYFEGMDVLQQEQYAQHRHELFTDLSQEQGIIILSGTQPWRIEGRNPLGVITVSFGMPGYTQRRVYWQRHLEATGITLDQEELDALANRFRLLPGQIAEAVATSHTLAKWRTATAAATENSGSGIIELCTAARVQTDHALTDLAHKIETRYTWADIVLPADTLAQLQEICQRVLHRHQVLGAWGFDHKLTLGKGVNALFAGPSGTGKTMAAAIIAHALELDLYQIDLSSVVSKYIGETEKNLARIFAAAQSANAILFFDEADALFGKRSEVRDAHDRYANIETAYLLQKMEEYEGLAILATNLRQNLDSAFTRRLAFIVHFPFPDEIHRLRIWESIWPAALPLADDVDLAALANQFRLAGGQIKNTALSAAFLAAADGGRVTTAHLHQAVRREFQKMGKVLAEEELNVRDSTMKR